MGQHGDKIREAALSKSAAAGSAVAASWCRSLIIHRLDPDQTPKADRIDEATLQKKRERLGRLSAMAGPAMDRLFSAVGESGCSVVLSDVDGVIVARRGKAGDDDAFKRWGLWTGADWSEAREGTNGIGTCLVEQRPVTIHRDQHFYAANSSMSCMGAPVFDHEGELVAVLDISSCRADLADAFVALLADAVSDAARRIEAENFQTAFAARRIVMASSPLEAGPTLLALDCDDLVVGATRRARKLYNLTRDCLADPRPARDILRATGEEHDLATAERAELRRALAHAHGNATRAARDLGISRAGLYRKMARLGVR